MSPIYAASVSITFETEFVHVTALSAQGPFAILPGTSIRFTNIDVTTSPKALINTFVFVDTAGENPSLICPSPLFAHIGPPTILELRGT